MDTTLRPVCVEIDESTEHLLISCPSAFMAWLFVSTWCKIKPTYAFSIKDLLDIHKMIDASKNKRDYSICHPHGMLEFMEARNE
ncbi:hypothetical protein QVD17_18819 [Tagetes erecta]|uniref:Uncharacterized protein n=1 Tax=Tagetes erecta TaxID=13708 RepID=A0AAD8KLE7_TARER|nr:hypothetical protein QVD17_18819 [Tagetes erecta]